MQNKFTLYLLFFCFTSFAQEKLPFIDFDDISRQATEYSERGDNEKTLEIFNQINKNDSAYGSVMVSKSYYLLALKKYDEAIAMVNKGLKKNYGDLNSSFYINKSVALLNQKKYGEALVAINEGLESFPKNSVLWYNKGVSLEYAGEIEKAVKAYQMTILLNPFYKKTYLQLGNLCYRQTLISQALMCFNMYLLLDPDGDNAFTILNSLNNIVNSKNENSKNVAIQISEDDDAFEEIDLVISNRIAMNSNYETGNEINIALIRQNHALLQQLKDFSGNAGFWDTKFVPFYRWIQNNGFFDIFTYTIAYSIENKKFKPIIKKNEKDIPDFMALSKSKWSEIVQKKKIEWYGAKEEVIHYYNDDYMQAVGKMDNDKTIGPWEFYNENGRLTGKGSYNEQGNRVGEWNWFNEFGKKSETGNYIDGVLNGKYFVYHSNGTLKIDSAYKTGNLDGEYKYYNDKGALIQKKYFKNDTLDGLYESYFKVGEELKEFNILYEKGKVKDELIEYYAFGSIYSEMPFQDGKRNGTELKYHLNGERSSEVEYVDGDLNGSYKSFYSNGKPLEIGQSENGYYHGSWKSFYDDGTRKIEYSYDKGYLDGLYKFYDHDGKPYYEYDYRRGEVMGFRFFDKSGEIIKEGKKKGGEFYYMGYSPDGVLTSEGLYDLKGGKKGVWKYYSLNGVLYEQGTYVDDKIQGTYNTYFKNGDIDAISTYENDTLSGYYVDYHKNGKMKTQGWYKQNNRHGEWRTYFIDGTISIISFYHKGLFHGEQQYFSGNGKRSGISLYEYDELVSDYFYDKNEKIVDQVDYRKVEENTYVLVTRHFNKKPKTEITYLKGVKHGSYKYFDYHGQMKVSGTYRNGEQHGDWIWYHDDGAIKSTATFVRGNVNGEYISYYENGEVESTYYYDFGSLEKKSFLYEDNATINTIAHYKNDELHGRKEFYSASGKLQIVRFYDSGRLIGYSHLDKNSEELPMIPLINETGKVKAYFDNGKVSREMEYENGNLTNTYREFYYSGQIANEITYHDGEFQGTSTEYFSNGKIKKQQEFLYDNLHGSSKEFYENGNLKKEETYLNNSRNGVSKTYDENGKLRIEEEYFNDEITDSKTY